MAGSEFIGLGVLFTVSFILFSIFTLLIRSRIEYTVALLQLGSSIIVKNPSSIVIACGVLLMQCIWTFICGAIVVAFGAVHHHANTSNNFVAVVLILVLSFIWNHQVIKNVGHTTICAVTAHWYFCGDAQYPTYKALSRCLTTSLGSIAMGSLFINLLQGIKSYFRVLRDFGHLCRGVKCGSSSTCPGISRLQYFNSVAFVHVAVYQTAYLKSGQSTFDLLKLSSIYQLMNSNFTDYALLCGSLCAGIVNGIVAAWMANYFEFETDWTVVYALLGMWIGTSVSSALLNTVSSCVVALFVCYAEEPKLLLEKHPEQALRFDGAKKGVA